MRKWEALRAFAEELVGEKTGEDGWRVAQFHRAPRGWDSTSLPAAWERLLVSVMQETGHPVLAAVVLDSDGAQLIGYSPKAGRWGGWLMLERIIGHLVPDAMPYVYEDENGEMHVDEGEEYQHRLRAACDQMYQVGPPADEAVLSAVQWAREAGSKPAAATVEAALNRWDTFAEDLFFRLIDALRLPGFGDSES
jgi:hypothetical protein